MDNHPSIGATSLGDLWDFGERQFPQYPIANIQILDVDFGTSVTNFRVQLMIADKVKNKNNESNPRDNQQTIPYYQVDDKVDIFANTLAIINDLTSYTQRGVQNFEINDDIVCKPFADRLDNGVAGWTAEFTLTTHNDKNRCLFFLINPSGSGYIIQDCETNLQYKAVLQETGSIGQVFASKSPNPPNGSNVDTYYNFRCYTIVDTFSGEDDYDYVNLPILKIPFADFGNCDYCELWTKPQVWSTTPQKWDGYGAAYRQWKYD
jgi:hypothetical protein